MIAVSPRPLPAATESGRLGALRATGLLDREPEPAFDRLTRLVCRTLRVPVALVSLVDEERQFFASVCGLAEPWASRRETPHSHSICKHVVDRGEEWVIADTREVDELRGNRAISELRAIAYLGMPLRAASGEVLGTLCAIDHEPRAWTGDEVATLRDLAALAETEIRAHRGGPAADAADFRLLIENGWDVVHIVDAAGVVRYASPAVERVLGFRPGEITGRHSSEFIHPEDVERAEEALRASFAHCDTHVCPELRLRHRDGSWRTVELIGRAVSDAAGEPVSIVNTHDITQRKQAEAALRQSEERFQLVSRATQDVIRDWDVPTGQLRWNEIAHRVFRRIPGEMGTRIEWWCDQIHPEDRERVVTGIHGAVNGIAEFWTDEYQVRRGDGSFAAVLDRACVVRDATGRPLRMISSTVDITERRRSEAAQRFLARVTEALDGSLQFEATLASLARLAVPAIADGCVVHTVGRDGAVRLAAAAHVDPAQEHLLEQPDSSPAELMATVHEVTSTGESRHRQAMPPTDGNLAAWAYLCVPMAARGRTLGAITLLAATAERRFGPMDLLVAGEFGRRAALAVDNAQLYHRACQAIRARDDVLAIVSHDLRNPLHTISLSAELLLEREPDRRTLTRRPLEVIKRSAGRMSLLLRDLLEISQIEAGGVGIDPHPFTAAAIVREACEMLNVLATEESLELHCECAADLPPVLADAERILRVLGNLVGNALKFTPAGGRITLRAARDGDRVRFSVSDTGPGIPPEHIPHLWDRFWQARRTDRRGAGLGLAIARGIVEAHGGEIGVESHPGEGATFWFTVPAVLESQS